MSGLMSPRKVKLPLCCLLFINDLVLLLNMDTMKLNIQSDQCSLKIISITWNYPMILRVKLVYKMVHFYVAIINALSTNYEWHT